MENINKPKIELNWWHLIIDDFIKIRRQYKNDYPNLYDMCNYLFVLALVIIVIAYNYYTLLNNINFIPQPVLGRKVINWVPIIALASIFIIGIIVNITPIILTITKYIFADNKYRAIKLFITGLDNRLARYTPAIKSKLSNISLLPDRTVIKSFDEFLQQYSVLRTTKTLILYFYVITLHFATSFTCSVFIISVSALIMGVYWIILFYCLPKFFDSTSFILFNLYLTAIMLNSRIPYIIRQVLSWTYPEYKLYKPSYGYLAILTSLMLIVIDLFMPGVSGTDLYKETGKLVYEYQSRAFIYITFLVSIERMLVNWKLVKKYNAKIDLENEEKEKCPRCNH